MLLPIATKAKWIPVTMADLLRLLQPIESSWRTLGYELLEDKLSYKIDTIESNCFHNHTYVAALDDVLKKWLDWATGTERSWQTLCDAAKKYGNNSLEKFLTENSLKSELIYYLSTATSLYGISAQLEVRVKLKLKNDMKPSVIFS